MLYMSFNIYLNNSLGVNKTISNNGSSITVILNPPIIFDQNKRYEMSLINSSVVYCNPNITSGKYLRFIYKGTDYNTAFTPGIYDIPSFNLEFKNLTGALFSGGSFNLVPDESNIIYFNDFFNTVFNLISNNGHSLSTDGIASDNVLEILGFNILVTNLNSHHQAPQHILKVKINVS